MSPPLLLCALSLPPSPPPAGTISPAPLPPGLFHAHQSCPVSLSGLSCWLILRSGDLRYGAASGHASSRTVWERPRVKTPDLSRSESPSTQPVHQAATVLDHSTRMWFDGRMRRAAISNIVNLTLMEVCLTACFVVRIIFLHLCIKTRGFFRNVFTLSQLRTKAFRCWEVPGFFCFF